MLANGLHRIRWRRVAVARIRRTAASQFARDLVNIQQSIVEEGVENVSKVTPSDPMAGRQAGKQEIIQQMSENSRSQIVFRTDIFRKLTLGAPD